MAQPERAGAAAPADEHALVARIVGGDAAAFEIVMRRHNGALFRTARAILRDDADAEDALQEAYLAAYRNLGTFRGDAQLATWLTRIVINQALMRVRARRRDTVVVPFGEGRDAGTPAVDVADDTAESPSEAAMRGEVRKVIERRIDELPDAFRTVFVMREVEEMTARETADALGIPEATVRTRLFRARALLRESLDRDMDRARGDVFGFDGPRCDRIVVTVMQRLAAGGW
jgi:RNA polymerase sigma-70 factor, ECF subfamily